MDPSKTLVLVSGGSGYLGLHCVKALLDKGYKVRATVRDPSKASKVEPLRKLCADESRLELVKADLLDAPSWGPAVEGCDFVLHTASPFPVESVRDEDVLIKPAREGTLNVLKAVAEAAHKVQRIVLTSSIAAVAYGYTAEPGRVFSEADWTRLDGGADVGAYIKSKTIAERAAWDFAKEKGLELATINPGFILGPPLSANDAGSSVSVIRDALMRKMPVCPRMMMDYVDVRDVAKAHVLAMEKSEAAGERFILSTHLDWYKFLCQTLQAEFGQYGYKPPTSEAPKWMLKLASFFDPVVKNIYPRIGYEYGVDASKMKRVLGIEPIPIQQTIKDMGHALIQLGFVPRKPGYKAPE